jgi:hypothetical protein
MAARASHIFSLPIPCRLPNAQPSVGFQTNVLPPESLAEGPRLFRLRYLATGCDQSSVSQDSLANELIAESIGSGNTGKAKAHIELKAKAHIELLLFLTSAAAKLVVECVAGSGCGSRQSPTHLGVNRNTSAVVIHFGETHWKTRSRPPGPIRASLERQDHCARMWTAVKQRQSRLSRQSSSCAFNSRSPRRRTASCMR